jgi:hypothetical protein
MQLVASSLNIGAVNEKTAGTSKTVSYLAAVAWIIGALSKLLENKDGKHQARQVIAALLGAGAGGAAIITSFTKGNSKAGATVAGAALWASGSGVELFIAACADQNENEIIGWLLKLGLTGNVAAPLVQGALGVTRIVQGTAQPPRDDLTAASLTMEKVSALLWGGSVTLLSVALAYEKWTLHQQNSQAGTTATIEEISMSEMNHAV